MASSDWRDALAALAGDLSPDTDGNEAPAPTAAAAPPSDRLSIFYERKGRGGKQATIITGFTCSDSELRAVASTLKQRLGCGGSARGGEILIQGDRRDDAAAALRALGYKI